MVMHVTNTIQTGIFPFLGTVKPRKTNLSGFSCGGKCMSIYMSNVCQKDIKHILAKMFIYLIIYLSTSVEHLYSTNSVLFITW